MNSIRSWLLCPLVGALGLALTAGCGESVADAGEGGVEEPTSMGSFQSLTSGGAFISSESYHLELFIAPLQPVGNRSSETHRIHYGPGAIRSVR